MEAQQLVEAAKAMMESDKHRKEEEIKQKYEEILTSLDFTFGSVKEAAEGILLYSTDRKVDKLAKEIIGLIDSRSAY